jgi:hypothetical protein
MQVSRDSSSRPWEPLSSGRVPWRKVANMTFAPFVGLNRVRGVPLPDRRAKLLIYRAMNGSILDVYLQDMAPERFPSEA